MTLQNDKIKKYFYYFLLGFVLFIGFFVRTKLYISQNVFEDDECRLALCIINTNLLSSFLPLGDAQSAPPLFVLFSKILGNLFGYYEKVLKFIPYVSGIFSIYFFYKISCKYLKNKFSILAANYIFALSKPLIAFSSIFKQYSSDVLLCLVCLYYLPNIKIKDLTFKQTVAFIIGLIILPLFSLPTLFFVGAFLLINLFENLKNKSFYKKLISIMLPFLCFLITYYVFILNPEKAGLNAAFPNYWNDGFFAFSLKDFLRIIIINLKFYFIPNSITLAEIILLLSGVGMYCSPKERKFLFLNLVSVLVFIAAFLQLYPFVGRVALYFLPICILYITKSLDVISKKIFFVALILYLLGFCHYNFNYLKNISTYDYFVNYSPNSLVKIIKKNYNPQKDIILLNNASAASYLFYSGKNNFFADDVYEMPINKKNENNALNYLSSLEKGHGYWIYFVKDYAKAQIFPLVLDWAKNENVKQYYKERDSYLLYIER